MELMRNGDTETIQKRILDANWWRLQNREGDNDKVEAQKSEKWDFDQMKRELPDWLHATRDIYIDDKRRETRGVFTVHPSPENYPSRLEEIIKLMAPIASKMGTFKIAVPDAWFVGKLPFHYNR